jgi:hypothetical protein
MSSRITRGLLLGAGLALAAAGVGQSAPLIQKDVPPPAGLLLEVSLPPLTLAEQKAKEEPLDFKGTRGKQYAAKPDPESRYCKAIHEVQVLLWASSSAVPPKPLAAEVAKVRKELRLAPAALKGRFDIPTTPAREKQLKAQALVISHTIARLMARMEDALDEMGKVVEDEKERPVRWQANYGLMKSALLLRMCVLDDYSLALGLLRKELPPVGKDQRAWQLKPTEVPHDVAGRKRIKEALHLLQRLRKDYPGTVWDQQAERLAATKVGGEWAAVK